MKSSQLTSQPRFPTLLCENIPRVFLTHTRTHTHTQDYFVEANVFIRTCSHAEEVEVSALDTASCRDNQSCSLLPFLVLPPPVRKTRMFFWLLPTPTRATGNRRALRTELCYCRRHQEPRDIDLRSVKSVRSILKFGHLCLARSPPPTNSFVKVFSFSQRREIIPVHPRKQKLGQQEQNVLEVSQDNKSTNIRIKSPSRIVVPFSPCCTR